MANHTLYDDSNDIVKPMLPYGTMLKHYRLVRLLGEGGMAQVFLARDTKLNRDVALKIPTDDIIRKGGAARFLREAQIAAQLDHPNIVRIYACEEDPAIVKYDHALPFFVMEYLEGGNLHDLLSQGPLPIEQVREVFAGICDAIDYAHQCEYVYEGEDGKQHKDNQGIIHRDLKPQNIGFDKRHRVVVLDFGLAKVLQSPDSSHYQHSTHGPVGTAEYISPEQWKNKDVDNRTDIYALGIILFQMLTGHLPFNGNYMELMSSHLFQLPPNPCELREDLAQEIAGVVLKALEKEKDNRFKSTTEFRIALHDAIVSSSEAKLACANCGFSGEPRKLGEKLYCIKCSKLWIPAEIPTDAPAQTSHPVPSDESKIVSQIKKATQELESIAANILETAGNAQDAVAAVVSAALSADQALDMAKRDSALSSLEAAYTTAKSASEDAEKKKKLVDKAKKSTVDLAKKAYEAEKVLKTEASRITSADLMPVVDEALALGKEAIDHISNAEEVAIAASAEALELKRAASNSANQVKLLLDEAMKHVEGGEFASKLEALIDSIKKEAEMVFAELPKIKVAAAEINKAARLTSVTAQQLSQSDNPQAIIEAATIARASGKLAEDKAKQIQTIETALNALPSKIDSAKRELVRLISQIEKPSAEQNQLIKTAEQTLKALATEVETKRHSLHREVEEAQTAFKITVLMVVMIENEAENARKGRKMLEDYIGSFLDAAAKASMGIPNRLRQNAATKNGTIHIYYDGLGYLTVYRATEQTLKNAARLTADCKIYIIAYSASDELLEAVKRTKDVQLYRLADMSIVKHGWGAPPKSDFEKFLEGHNLRFRKI